MESSTIMNHKKNIGLIYGGKSGEHEVSVKTAFSILNAMDYTKYTVLPVFISLDGTWYVSDMLKEKPTSEKSFINTIKTKLENLFSFFQNEIDIAFPVIHGPNGEDGRLQGLLEMLDVPYVGNGVFASSAGMDKALMKRMFEQAKLPQCKHLEFTIFDFEKEPVFVYDQIENRLSFPCFVKPANLGSSIGISKAKNREDLVKALRLAFSFDNKIVVEEAVVGKEVEIGVLGNEEPICSVIGEISTTNDFYDYEAKYQNETATSLQIPSTLPVEAQKEMEELAKLAYKTLDCSGLARIDFFYVEKTKQFFINEINTMPGFTPYSMYPMLFKEAGIPYPSLIDRLIQFGVEKFEQKQKLQITEKKETFLS